jgi:hypothetical protein
MKLGQALCRIAAVHPHYFNSFYRRVRVVRENPRPVPAAATVDVTHVCSLRCPFCIAAGVLGDREMDVATFASLAAELEGIGRLTLIGGEPFQHKGLSDLCRQARAAASEVEIFTNGLVLGTVPDAARERLLERIPDASKDWLTLVLSVDPDHASRMSEGRLELAVRAALALDRAGLGRARFSITHAALRTGSYLDTDTLVQAMQPVSPTLARLFPERLLEGRLQDTFYFNSVICGAAEGGELLRIEDLAFSPEVAISFDTAGTPIVFTSLAAMWTGTPPPGAVLGTLSQATDRLLGHAGLSVAAPPSTNEWTRVFELAEGLADAPARDRLIRARWPLSDFESWDGGNALVRRRADALFQMLAHGVGGRPMQCGGDEAADGLEVPVMAALLARMSARPGWRDSLLRSLTSFVAGLFLDKAGRPRRPVYAGEREILGNRVPLAPGEELPINQVHLPGEKGFGPRHELVIRPRLIVLNDHELRLEFPGPRGIPAELPLPRRAMDSALGRVLSMVAALAGPEILRDTVASLPEPLKAASARLPGAPSGGFSLLGTDDPVAAFHACTFDRNRQRSDEENAELLALLLARGRGRFSDLAWTRFVSAAMTWLERLPAPTSPRSPIYPTARALLSRVESKGQPQRRIGKLLDAWGRAASDGGTR